MSLISPCVVWTDVRATRRLGSRFCPVRTFGVEFSVPRSPIVLCACLHSFWQSFCPAGDRWLVVLGRGPLAQEDLGTLTGIFSVCPECLEMLGDYCEVLRDHCGLCFPWKYPKARREAFATTETYFGRPSRVPEGCLKLVPRPWLSLGASRPVLRGRLLVSGANPGCSVRKGVRGGSGCPGLSRMPRKCARTSRWSLWH
ncbi:hypothetical protein CDL15_Pgr019839 [Punica granatum]|uniref:Uncharacterized protein n=1 Tax=Punica granatum TaxID=22663 RepID=A0A218XRZ4_PUNGR|nr:hypothetical protein CDL15_Pgr019839 [Punica granatum]